MKKSFSLSLVFIGLVIGAGFASGREIFEYFTLPGKSSSPGIITAGVFFGVLIYIIMNISRRTNARTFEDFIRLVSPRLAPFIKVFMNIFIFCGFFVMLSASGTLFAQALGLPFWSGAVFLGLVCITVLTFDLKGLVAANIILVPLMLFGMLALCLILSIREIPTFSLGGALRQSPTAMALCYVSYNTVTAGAVIVPLTKGMTRKNMAAASIFSAGILVLLIASVHLTLNSFYTISFRNEMPLLALASGLGKYYSLLYALVLFMALCTTALSYGFSLLQQLPLTSKKSRFISATLLCVLSLPFAGLGFSSLIANLYAVFGFLGLIWTAMIIYRFLSCK